MSDENDTENELIGDLDSLQKDISKTKKMLDRQVEILKTDINEIKKEIEDLDSTKKRNN